MDTKPFLPKWEVFELQEACGRIFRDVMDERLEQLQRGYDAAHDDASTSGELAMAASCYALPDEFRYGNVEHPSDIVTPDNYPLSWALKHWRPSPDNRRKELVKAAALIFAEIARLERMGSVPTPHVSRVGDAAKEAALPVDPFSLLRVYSLPDGSWVKAVCFTEQNKDAVYRWACEKQMNVTPSFSEDGSPVLRVPYGDGTVEDCAFGDYLLLRQSGTDSGWSLVVSKAEYFKGEPVSGDYFKPQLSKSC